MAASRLTLPVFSLPFLGAGLTCSALALATAALAQDTAAPAADAAAAPAADGAPVAWNDLLPAEGQTWGQAGAARAAADLAAGKDDEPRILHAPAPDSRRVYVNDPAHFAAITQQFVIDGEHGRVIGMVDGGFLPNPVVADDGSMIAQASTVFSRIARGKREDYVEVLDATTLQPTADITLPDAPRFLVGTYPWMTALTPDNAKLLFYQFSPAPAVGVVDLAGKAFEGLLDVPDCYHIFPTAPDTFFMHCRDGSMAKVTFGAAGTEPTITQSAAFHGEEEFLINHPAYSMKAQRLIWPSYTGKIYQLDLSSGEAKVMSTIDGLTADELGQGWRPGGWQQVAYHRPSERIFLLVDQRDQWRHKTASRFVLVIDGKTGQRIAKLEMGHEIDSVAVSQDDNPLLYGLSTGDRTLYIYEAETGKELRSVNQLGRGPQVLTVADMN